MNTLFALILVFSAPHNNGGGEAAQTLYFKDKTTCDAALASVREAWNGDVRWITWGGDGKPGFVYGVCVPEVVK